MKSKKAETYLNRIYKGGIKIKAYHRASANKAVEIAEDEIEEKAKKAYCKSCYFSVTCENKFNDNCSFLKEFINELNK